MENVIWIVKFLFCRFSQLNLQLNCVGNVFCVSVHKSFLITAAEESDKNVIQLSSYGIAKKWFGFCWLPVDLFLKFTVLNMLRRWHVGFWTGVEETTLSNSRSCSWFTFCQELDLENTVSSTLVQPPLLNDLHDITDRKRLKYTFRSC